MKLFCSVCLCVAIAMVALGCASVGTNPENIYHPLNYTEADAVNTELERIESLLGQNSIEALWRSVLLKNSVESSIKESVETSPIADKVSEIDDMQKKCVDKAVSDFNAHIEKKEYVNALSIMQSFEAIDASYVLQLGIEKAELEKLAIEKLENENTVSDNFKLSSAVDGTVTVWVDRGIAIQGGMGYADRVIGSGFFISGDGYLITNHHVIADLVDPKSQKYSKLFVKLASDNETRIPAKVIGYDSLLDLALLKVEIDSPFVFSLGSSEDLDIGDTVFAIGSPVGLERTLTSGSISAKDRKLSSVGNVFQIDTAVNPGNSGGPLIDKKGNVQAIVFAGMLQYEGLNFAIPVEYLKAELPILANGGERKHSWIGAFGKPKKDMGKNIGIEVLYVMPGGSASRAGLKEGDIITAVNGSEVKNNDDLFNIFLSLLPNTVITITTSDLDGNTKDLLVYLNERPKAPGYEVYKRDVVANSFYPIFGMKLETLSGSKKYTIGELVNGGIADESGFTDHDPVEIGKVIFNDEKTAIAATLYTKKKKSGYIDVAIGLTAQLDNQYYF